MLSGEEEGIEGKGNECWHIAWMIEDKTLNLHHGSCKKVNQVVVLVRLRK